MIDARHVLCGLALGLSMCGGGAERPAAAPSNANQPTSAPPPPSPMGAPAPVAPSGYPEPAAAPAPPMEAPATQSAGAAAPPGDVQRAAAREELERSERSLEASMNDCAAACRALASMDRAVTHLCALVDSPGEQRRCDDARQRLASARRRVRETCGACAN